MHFEITLLWLHSFILSTTMYKQYVAQNHLKHGLSTSDIILKVFETFCGFQNTGQNLEKMNWVTRDAIFLNNISCLYFLISCSDSSILMSYTETLYFSLCADMPSVRLCPKVHCNGKKIPLALTVWGNFAQNHSEVLWVLIFQPHSLISDIRK